jgi:alanyl-tRNA synthetase
MPVKSNTILNNHKRFITFFKSKNHKHLQGRRMFKMWKVLLMFNTGVMGIVAVEIVHNPGIGTGGMKGIFTQN